MECPILLNPFLLPTIAVALALFLFLRYYKNNFSSATLNIYGPPALPYFGHLEQYSQCINFEEVNQKIYHTFDKYGSVFKIRMAHEVWVCLADHKFIGQIYEYWMTYEGVPSFNFYGYAKQNAFVYKNFFGCKEVFDMNLTTTLKETIYKDATADLISALREKDDIGPEEIKRHVKEFFKYVLSESDWKLQLTGDCRNQIILPIRDRLDLALWKFINGGVGVLASQLLDNTHASLFKTLQNPVDIFGIKKNDTLGVISPHEMNLEFTEDTLNHLADDATKEVASMISESVETSTTFLVYLLRDLAARPLVANKIREEVAKFRAANGREPTLADERQLFYTEMVIKEALRLYSPPGVFVRTGKDFTIGDKTIAKNTLVYICSQKIHTDYEFYKNPMGFEPEHFSYEAQCSQPAGTYLPLGLEPSICQDKRLFLKIMKILLVSLLSNMSFETKTLPEEFEYNYFNLKKPLEDFHLVAKPL